MVVEAWTVKPVLWVVWLVLVLMGGEDVVEDFVADFGW